MFVALLHSNSHRLCFSDRILPRKRLGDSKCPAYFRVMPSILIDSASPDITYSGLQWQSGFDPEVHGGSFNTCRTDLNASSTATAVDSAPTMALTFSGESKAHLIGMNDLMSYVQAPRSTSMDNHPKALP